VLRAFYGRYYQAPPLLTIGGPLLGVAAAQGFGFLPLRGEKDEQHSFGITVPVKGWTAEVDYFRTRADNYFDHDVLGNSNIFFPVTLEHARIRGWEASMRSPRVGGRVQWHLAYSHQYAEARGGVTGGLTNFEPPDTSGYYFLDHDQRNTLSTGAQATLPARAWLSLNVAYGSGFLDGDGPAHLPAHASADFSVGKAVGENWSVQFAALNFTDTRYLLDNSNTFGGTHYAYPRQLSVRVKYRFHY
jgi:outer membrane receptor protein involved in Fe transport